MSVENLFIETITGNPVIEMFLTCLLKLLAAPFLVASTFSDSNSSFGGLLPPPVEKPPPCNFILLTVTFITTQSGVLPEAKDLICRAFSAPISAPKPASVTT